MQLCCPTLIACRIKFCLKCMNLMKDMNLSKKLAMFSLKLLTNTYSAFYP
uniref:Uncharacterized protein n=1 Tax=Anguilla anguilla TaxID=7936 RepID=A0A0E9TA65_ANGAN